MLDQVRNGTHVVHIFEAMEILIKDSRNGYGKEGNMFEEWCIPRLKEIDVELNRRHPSVPLMVCSRVTC